MSQTIEQAELVMTGLGQRWVGPLVIRAGVSSSKLGQIRRAWYENGILEEVICLAPGQATAAPEVWPIAQGNFVPTPEPQPPPPPTGSLVKAIDVSNFQDADLTTLIAQYTPDHVIVRIPQRFEPTWFQGRAQAQLQSALAQGKTVGAYCWLYRDENIADQIQFPIGLLRSWQITVPYLWPDIEYYKTPDNIPSAEQIKEAVHVSQQEGVRPGIYTSKYMWSLIGTPTDPELSALPLWNAQYNEVATLDMEPYGGWTTCVGHQYSTTGGIDQDVFDSRYAV